MCLNHSPWLEKNSLLLRRIQRGAQEKILEGAHWRIWQNGRLPEINVGRGKTVYWKMETASKINCLTWSAWKNNIAFPHENNFLGRKREAKVSGTKGKTLTRRKSSRSASEFTPFGWFGAPFSENADSKGAWSPYQVATVHHQYFPIPYVRLCDKRQHRGLSHSDFRLERCSNRKNIFHRLADFFHHAV